MQQMNREEATGEEASRAYGETGPGGGRGGWGEGGGGLLAVTTTT